MSLRSQLRVAYNLLIILYPARWVPKSVAMFRLLIIVLYYLIEGFPDKYFLYQWRSLFLITYNRGPPWGSQIPPALFYLDDIVVISLKLRLHYGLYGHIHPFLDSWRLHYKEVIWYIAIISVVLSSAKIPIIKWFSLLFVFNTRAAVGISLLFFTESFSLNRIILLLSII